MRCAECREVVSAALDGEAAAVEQAAADEHLTACPACSTWAETATLLHRTVRVRPVVDAVDRSGLILAAVPSASRPTPSRPVARRALAAVGLAQVAVALPALVLAEKEGAPVHLAREVGAFEMALGAGLLAAAWRPRLAPGMVPFAAALVGVVLLASVLDLTGGRAAAVAEVHHLLGALGLVLMAGASASRTRTVV